MSIHPEGTTTVLVGRAVDEVLRWVYALSACRWDVLLVGVTMMAALFIVSLAAFSPLGDDR